MGLSNEQSQIFLRTLRISNLEMRLLRLSSEKDMKYAEGCGKTSQVTNQMTIEVDGLRESLSEDATSEEYKQVMDKIQSVENEYQIILQNIQDQMEAAEEKIDRQQETVETQLEVQRSELDQWKQARDKTVETTFHYFR